VSTAAEKRLDAAYRAVVGRTPQSRSQ
jgi:hypothetical protein